MNEKAIISNGCIILNNKQYSSLDYSLYNLEGTLLQKGCITENTIQVDPDIDCHTVILVLMSHSNIFSQKLHFIQ